MRGKRVVDRQFVGAYHLLEQVGRGGAGAVYRGRHIHPAYDDRAFCVKVQHAQTDADPDALARFRREAYVLSLLQHRNVVRTFEAGIDGDELFIAMEYVDGRDLADLIARNGRRPMPTFIALHVVRRILAGLHHGHTLCDSGGEPLGVIHRDIKPSNVLLSYDGEVKIADFGIATLAGRVAHATPERIMGTAGYAAPELLRGDAVDRRSDVFAVGVVLFELLCGSLPYTPGRLASLLTPTGRVKTGRPRKLNPDLPAGLEEVVLTAIAPKPHRRFASAGAMLDALEPYAGGGEAAPLALRAFIRSLVLGATNELVLRAGDEKPKPEQPVVIYAAPAVQRRVAELLGAAGIDTHAHGSVVSLERALRGSDGKGVVVIDAAAGGVHSGALYACLRELAPSRPVIAVCDRLEPDRVRGLLAFAPEDVLWGALERDRVVSAVQVADAFPTRERVAPVGGAARQPLPVRLVTADKGLAAALAPVLARDGLRVDVAPSSERALAETVLTSHRALLYDLGPFGGDGPGFVRRFRQSPGMAAIPSLLLAGREPPPASLPDGCAVCPRDASPGAIAQALATLRSSDTMRRSFTRIPLRAAVQLRFGGRSFSATCADLSRGGMLVRCQQIPPVGTRVRVELRTARGGLELTGDVVRVELPDASSEMAGIAVAFTPGPSRAEAVLISYIAVLEAG